MAKEQLNSCTPAQKAAYSRYRAKKAADNARRIPGVFLSEEEWDLLVDMASRYGSKKAALIEGLKQLKVSHD